MVELPTPIPAGSHFRLTFDAQAVGQTQGYIFGVDDVMFRIVAPGDTDGNGEVNSEDLFNILEAGKFNHPELGPATWLEGDFSGDDLVNSTDLFLILATGKYNQGPYTTAAALATIPEPSSIVLAVIALAGFVVFIRRRTGRGGVSLFETRRLSLPFSPNPRLSACRERPSMGLDVLGYPPIWSILK